MVTENRNKSHYFRGFYEHLNIRYLQIRNEERRQDQIFEFIFGEEEFSKAMNLNKIKCSFYEIDDSQIPSVCFKYIIIIFMFSTYVWPYNFFAAQFQPYTYYTPTIIQPPYLDTSHNILPTNFNSMFQVPKQNLLKTFKTKKIIKKQQKQEKITEKSTQINMLEKKAISGIEEYTFKSQNLQRNLLSNLLHHLVSFILKNAEFKSIIEKIIKVHHLNITSLEVIKFASKINLRSYIKASTIQGLWSQNNVNKELSKALRIFSYYFLKQKSYILVCDSRRIKSGTKLQHLTKIRYLIKLLFLS